MKAQSAIEFIVLASFMLLVIVGFFAVTSSKVLESKEQSNIQISQDIAEFAYKEIAIAKSVNDGYTRTFAMPQTVNGVNYSITIIDNRELVVNYLGYEYIKFLPSNVTGNISKGSNTITKKEGIVFVSVFVSSPVFREAENLALSSGYVSSPSCVCSTPSNGRCARNNGIVGREGNITFASFPNPSGSYSITVRYCDENYEL